MAKLAFELCGNYRIDPTSPVGFRSSEPLTSVNDIKKYLRANGLKGYSSAIKAINIACDNSASPMETCLALLLGLPTSKGGYGLGLPVLNAVVTAPQGLLSKTNFHRYHCDLYWPENKVALEYNSSAFHLNEEALNRDSSRMNDLKSFGISGFTATRPQISDPKATDQLAFELAKAMHKRIRSKYRDIDERRMRLRRKLFSRDPWV